MNPGGKPKYCQFTVLLFDLVFVRREDRCVARVPAAVAGGVAACM